MSEHRLIVGDEVRTYIHHGPSRLVALDADGEPIGAPIEVRSSTLVTVDRYDPADDEPVQLVRPFVLRGRAELTEGLRAVLFGDPPLDKIARRR